MLSPGGPPAQRIWPENNLEASPPDHSRPDEKGDSAKFAREIGVIPYRDRTARPLPGHMQNRKAQNGKRKRLAEKENSDKNE